jgi:site-specific recombinase XerD
VLLAYLDQYRLKMTRQIKHADATLEPLFLTVTGRPLTKGAIGLLFGRLRERVALPGKTISVSLMRKNFAVRYVQTGGDAAGL